MRLATMPSDTPLPVPGSTTKAPPGPAIGSPAEEAAQGKFTFHIPRLGHDDPPGSARGGGGIGSSAAWHEETRNEGITSLVAEMRDVKNLLRAVLLADKTPGPAATAQEEEEEEEKKKNHEIDPDPTPSTKTGDLAASPLYEHYRSPEITELARRHCPNEEGMALFRDHFLAEFLGPGGGVEEEEGEERATAADPTVVRKSEQPTIFRCKGPQDTVLRVHRTEPAAARRPAKRWWHPVDWWLQRRSTLPERRQRLLLENDEAKRLIEEEWPVSWAQGVEIDGKICLRWKPPRDGFKLSWDISYLYYGSGSGMVGCDRFHTALFITEIERGIRPMRLHLGQLFHVGLFVSLPFWIHPFSVP